jgi:hypothetical protein
MTRIRRAHLTVFIAANLGAIVALFILCVTLPCFRRAQTKVARDRVRAVDTALASYSVSRGRCPATPADLIAHGRLPASALVDPWGTSIAYWCADRGSHVLSAGRDRQFNTSDDVIHVW